MNSLDCSNTWVFVSHSNKDFDKVIRLRNKLEALNYKPLLFFLKCLEEDAEIFELIKREIKARDRFILCESKNSKNSEWVLREIEYIKSLKRPYETINLEDSEDEINAAIKRFDQRSTMYIWSTEECVAALAAKELVERAYKTCILPEKYINNYYLFKTGSPDLADSDFYEVNGNGYVLILLSRQLTPSESSIISHIASYLKNETNHCRIYIISEEAMSNGKLYYELANYDGIKPKIIYNGAYSNCNFANSAADIVNDICELDRYQHQNQ